MKEEIVNKILQTLQSQKFADWYEHGNFDKFISGDLEHEQKLTREQADQKIKLEIVKLFHL